MKLKSYHTKRYTYRRGRYVAGKSEEAHVQQRTSLMIAIVTDWCNRPTYFCHQAVAHSRLKEALIAFNCRTKINEPAYRPSAVKRLLEFIGSMKLIGAAHLET